MNVISYLDANYRLVNQLKDAVMIDVRGEYAQGQVSPNQFSFLPPYLSKGALIVPNLSSVGFKKHKSLNAAEEHKISYYKKNGKLYVKTFLIDDTRNGNGWRATWSSIKKNHKTFHNGPGIEFLECSVHGCRLDHTGGETEKESRHIQEKYRGSTIVDTVLDHATHTAYAIHRIDNPQLQRKIERGEIKYLSPSIWPNSEKTTMTLTEDDEWYIDTTDWVGLHDAWVDKPAYGHKARIVGKCEGDDSCIEQLKNDKSLVARATSVLYQLKALQAAVDKHGNKGEWKTIKGTRVFIEEGKTVDEAIKDKFDKSEKTKEEYKQMQKEIKEIRHFLPDFDESIEGMAAIFEDLGLEQYIGGSVITATKDDKEQILKDVDKIRNHVANLEKYHPAAAAKDKLWEIYSRTSDFIDNHKTVWRGTSQKNLINVLKTGRAGADKEDSMVSEKNDLVHATIDYDTAHKYADTHGEYGVIIEFDTADVSDDDISPVDFELRPHVEIEQPDGSYKRFDEHFGGSHPYKWADDLEVHIRRNTPIKIRRVYGDTLQDETKKLLKEKGIPFLSAESGMDGLKKSLNARALKVLYQLKALKAKREIITRDDGKKGYWITVKGSKVFVEEHQSQEEAIKQAFGDKNKTKKDPNGFNVFENQKVTLDADEDTHHNLIDNMRILWNDVPDWRKRNVSELIIAEPIEFNGGKFTPYENKITIQHYNHTSRARLKKILDHELGHYTLHSLSADVMEDWAKRTKHIGPISDYAAGFNTMGLHSVQEHAQAVAKSVEYVTKYAWDEDSFEDAMIEEGMEELFHLWGIKSFEDIKSGKLEKESYDYWVRAYHIYANEQHSELMAAMRGGKLEMKGFNEDNFQQLKKVYEDMGLDSMKKSLNARALKVLYQLKALQATKFQPDPGEEPDEDGNYWRTVMGKKIPFKKGEETSGKLKGEPKSEKTKAKPEKKETDTEPTKKEKPKETTKKEKTQPKKGETKKVTPADFTDKTKFQADLPSEIMGEIKGAWDTIPAKYKEEIGEFIIRGNDKANTVGGLYSNADKTMIIAVADKDPKGIQYVLWHEVNHHRFLHYDNKTVLDWKVDYAELRARLGKGPSKYADSFVGDDHQAAMDEYLSRTESIKENLAKKHYTPADYFGREYTDLQSDVISIPKSLKDPKSSKAWKKRGREVLKQKKQEIKNLEKRFDSLNDEEKRTGIESRLAQRKPRGNEIDNITANEAHSEIGGWIHAQQSMRDHGMVNPDMAVNEDVIEEYAKLYRRHFET